MTAAINMLRYINSESLIEFDETTCIGALAHFITNASPKYFQPMNANWGIIKEVEFSEKDKIKNKELRANYALEKIKSIKTQYNL